MKKDTWEERFDNQFGKDGPEGNSDSVGRGAGCDDCWGNIKLRREHKQFVLLEKEKSYQEGYEAARKAMEEVLTQD